MSSGGTRAGEGAPGSRATGATAVVSFGSEEAGTGTGAEAGGGTDAGEGAPGSRATGATAALSFGAEEAVLAPDRGGRRDRRCNVLIKS